MGAPTVRSKRQTWPRLRLSDARFGAALSLPGVIALVALIIVPVILLFILSVMDYGPLTREFAGASNFIAVLGDRLFWLALKNTITYTVGVVTLTLAGGMTLALCLSRVTRGSTIFRTAGLFPWAVPLVVSALMWAWFFDPNAGLFNPLMQSLGLTERTIHVLSDPQLAMMAVVLADAWTRIPFLSIFILAGVEGIPQEYYEAARVDGASRFGTFWRITLPLVRAPLLTGLLIVSMFSFRALDAVFTMTAGGPSRATYTLAYYLADQLWVNADFGLGAATGVYLLIMIGGVAAGYVYFINRAPEVS